MESKNDLTVGDKSLGLGGPEPCERPLGFWKHLGPEPEPTLFLTPDLELAALMEESAFPSL